MKHLIVRFGLPVFVVALMLLAGMRTSAQPTSAAPLLAVTGTPTEPPTRTPSPQPQSTATATPGTQPTNTPKPTSKPSKKVADPSITKSASPSEARIGDEVTFTITVTNKGNETAKDVAVSDSLADYLDLLGVSASRGDVATSGNSVTVTIGDLAPGEVVTIQIRTRVNDRAQPPTGRNGATVTTSSTTDDPSNNTAEVTFTIVIEPTPSATVPPTVTATATPVVPASLPRTGGDGGFPIVSVVAAIGLLALALSLLVRRRARG